ncbi:NAD+ synthase [Oharaeibacter diazotrophicus]|uniref:Glutamine-dependent NAD(+) synthetase n=1 Tax=Oharaeibacter diazotrophicus TaxID=1920512 RepID=A0A4R6RIP0_9HYPH|nr:NAD+ synthase [Oharaeibacter diazotrophicus]TDP86252.1 NAD+ synthase [Oharaeibacter diazotrophicus]BBE71807.1 glutamine-dependent NAD(+) synthetase [Pleomorphomonas sp. SM30]GLS78572.1 NAD+ synthase [Oharaeibacter diazotrophicus]
MTAPAPIADTLRLALAQLDPVMGDVDGNLARARAARAEAAAAGADLVVFSELFVCGYLPEDLVLKPALQRACRAAVEALAADTADGGPGVLIGTPWAEGGRLHNAVVLLDAGRVEAVRFKVDLPNYGVFDEKRVFAPGPMPGPAVFRGVRLGLPICEDIWGPDVVECLSETGTEILVVVNGSPYRRTVHDERLQVAVARVVESGLPLVYVNQVGGQDELVFDGASFGLSADRSLAFRMADFREEIRLVECRRHADGAWDLVAETVAAAPEPLEAIWRACVLGLADYVDKNRFPGVVLGLSGGIDSAVVAAMAVDALGAERVRCLMLPYRYTSMDSLEDAAACAAALGVSYDVVPIADPVEGFLQALGPLFEGRAADITEENLQSRARGTILMAVSNKFGPMVLTTGNKSEMSVGYATLYGDMNGGFNPIKDIYKTEVYRLAAWRNAHRLADLKGPGGVVIPERIITKAPTAELRENQTDQDSLPPYDVLDGILECLVEHEMPLADVVARGFDPATVRRIEHLLYIAEYKRRQAAPGVKITTRNFGRDRRYPITNRFRDRT